MDKIIIKGAKFRCNIGISEKERRHKQNLFVDVEIFLSAKKAAITDDINDAIDYSKIHELMKNVSEKKGYNLIESLAENIAKIILNNFPAKKVVVRVKKPLVVKKNIKYIAVEISRKKNG